MTCKELPAAPVMLRALFEVLTLNVLAFVVAKIASFSSEALSLLELSVVSEPNAGGSALLEEDVSTGSMVVAVVSEELLGSMTLEELLAGLFSLLDEAGSTLLEETVGVLPAAVTVKVPLLLALLAAPVVVRVHL